MPLSEQSISNGGTMIEDNIHDESLYDTGLYDSSPYDPGYEMTEEAINAA